MISATKLAGSSATGSDPCGSPTKPGDGATDDAGLPDGDAAAEDAWADGEATADAEADAGAEAGTEGDPIADVRTGDAEGEPEAAAEAWGDDGGVAGVHSGPVLGVHPAIATPRAAAISPNPNRSNRADAAEADMTG